VSLTPNQQRLQQYMMQLKTQFTPDLVEFKDRFILSFQQLSTAGGMDSAMLSSNHTYLVYSPYCLFLWHGHSVEVSRRKGSLHILKCFLNSQLYEQVNYQASYHDKD
jgi:hypothetical protein